MSDLALDHSNDLITVTVGGQSVAEYHLTSDVDAVNTPKPYLHPLRTLGGTVITGFAPDDHPWHHGLQFAFPRVGEHNLWGGGTYFSPDEGYRVVEDQGSIRHDDLASTEGAVIRESLTWLGHGSEELLREERIITPSLTSDGWLLQFESTLTNLTDAPIELATPAQRGRPDGGYGGLFLRFGENLQADELIGESGVVDASGAESRTLVVHGHTPEGERCTLGLSFLPHAAPGAQKWLYRFAPEPFSAIGWAGAYDDGFELAVGGSISFAYRLAIFDGTVNAERVRELL